MTTEREDRATRQRARRLAGLSRLAALHRLLDRALAVFEADPPNPTKLRIRGSARGLFHEPDVRTGVILGRTEAPELYRELAALSGAGAGPFPDEIRLSYLPACGAVEPAGPGGPDRRILILGYPCLQVWNRQELLGSIAHELAHWRHGHGPALGGLSQRLDRLATLKPERPGKRRTGPFRSFLADRCHRRLEQGIREVAWDMEYEADALAASRTGADHLRRALVRLALAAPVFHQVLHAALLEDDRETPIYDRFDEVWRRLDQPDRATVRRKILNGCLELSDPTHPPLAERLRRLKETAEGRPRDDRSSALSLIAEPEKYAAALHGRIFREDPDPEPTFLEGV
jgi:Zn-dependent protease with chaperone function